MKRSIHISALLIVILLLGATTYSCSGGDGPVWTGPDYPAGGIPDGEWVDNHALALTDDGDFGIVIMNAFGESIVYQTVLDTDRKIVDVPGVVWIGPDGDALVMRFDENGWPNHAVYGTSMFVFGNWDDTTVDMAIMHGDGAYEILEGIDRSLASLDFPISKPGQPLELIKFDGNDVEVVLEELPTLGVRNTGSPYYLSPYGRSMQCYDYSSGFSIVPPRDFSDSSSMENWALWGLAGMQLGACPLDEYTGLALKGLPCGDIFVNDATLALLNPGVKPFHVVVSTAVEFGNASPLADTVEAYSTAKEAEIAAQQTYKIAMTKFIDLEPYADYYYQGTPW